MTNGDFIRSLCDEELADFLSDIDKFSPCLNCEFNNQGVVPDSCCAPYSFICVKEYAAALIYKFLQSEHRNDGEKSPS